MDFSIRHFAEVGSTMETAKGLISGGLPSPAIVLADRQLSGRGRIEGRRWEGVPGASLLMTLCLRGNAASRPAPPLRVGLGVVDVLARLAGPAFRIKWPNDIMGLRSGGLANCAAGGELDGRKPASWGKLGGLLCEVSGEWFLAGIGLNLRPAAYSPTLAAAAVSVEEAAAAHCAGTAGLSWLEDAEALAADIGEAVARRLGDDAWRDDYERLLWARGEEVSFVAGHPERGETRRGKIRGVDEAGRLVLATGGGEEEAFWSGEISSVRAV
jgi:BirA family biotin operon repressor/biotin-[acetyl-CoA-carboxylase] ligase